MSDSPALTTTHIDFDGLRIAFDERILRPRPWTALQSRWAASLLPGLPPGPVLELCAGAGHIGLRAILGSDRELVCVDANAVAAEFTAVNAESVGLGRSVEVREGPMSTVLGDAERFALVLADPPYLRSADVGQYPEDPVSAVDGGDDGLDLVRECLALIALHLAPGGTALLQLLDRAQAEQVVGFLPDDLALTEVREYDGQGVVVRLDPPTP